MIQDFLVLGVVMGACAYLIGRWWPRTDAKNCGGGCAKCGAADRINRITDQLTCQDRSQGHPVTLPRGEV